MFQKSFAFFLVFLMACSSEVSTGISTSADAAVAVPDGRIDLGSLAVVCKVNCDDQNPCTVDKCQVDKCQHEGVYCEDGNPCTVDTCDKATGKCLHPSELCGLGGGQGDMGPCMAVSDCEKYKGTATLTAACSDMVCEKGDCYESPKDCDDQNPCTNDTCHPQQGCGHQPIPNCKP